MSTSKIVVMNFCKKFSIVRFSYPDSLPLTTLKQQDIADDNGWKGKALYFLRPILSAFVCWYIMLAPFHLRASDRTYLAPNEWNSPFVLSYFMLSALFMGLTSFMLDLPCLHDSDSLKANRFLNWRYAYGLIADALAVIFVPEHTSNWWRFSYGAIDSLLKLVCVLNVFRTPSWKLTIVWPILYLLSNLAIRVGFYSHL